MAILSERLWKHTTVLAHEGHQGMVRTKTRLREKVWWPGMDKQVEEVVRDCHSCQLVGPPAKPEPAESTKPPIASEQFETFLEYLGIQHKKGVPYWPPQSNEEVERCN